jgi:hypothetical protein
MHDLPKFDADHLAAAGEADFIRLLVEHEDRVPRALFDACVCRGDTMVAALADYFSRSDGSDDDEDEYNWWMEVHGFWLSGAIPGEDAGCLLIDLLHRADRRDDYTLDWVAGSMAWLFANKPPAVIDLARKLVQDREAGWYVRCEVADAVVAAAMAAGAEALDAALDWLAAQVADESDDADFRRLTANILLDFPRARHRAFLEDLAAEQEAGPRLNVVFDSGDVARHFALGKDTPDWVRRGEPWKFYDDAEIQARQERWREEDARALARQAHRDEPFEHIHEPYVRDLPKPGRNDPCPCGSGKKYKKCCLPADGAREAQSRLLH